MKILIIQGFEVNGGGETLSKYYTVKPMECSRKKMLGKYSPKDVLMRISRIYTLNINGSRRLLKSREVIEKIRIQIT